MRKAKFLQMTAEPEADDLSLSMKEFLESTPPGTQKDISDVVKKRAIYGGSWTSDLSAPNLYLHCSDESCGGPRFFRYLEGDRVFTAHEKRLRTFLTFVCSNCQRSRKMFALDIHRDSFTDNSPGTCLKLGEDPGFGPPTPTRLLRLFGSDSDLFLKGRRCETQSLGIGAFAYYRRVVESHKNQILDEIYKVSKALGAPNEFFDELELAKKEIQFTKAMAAVKEGVPQALLINGHNPLNLLHSALSKGVHELADEECLELAHAIRVVLAELAERISQALKDEAELNNAVSRLLANNSKKK